MEKHQQHQYFEKYMHRSLQIAKNGAGSVSPNPMVGSVIVHKDKIIGEGYHRQFGQAHAEVNAINSVKDKSLLSESDLFVNLEPCSHFGKTPPCVDYIISHKIPRVVIGCVDTFSKVQGRGVKKLRLAGVEVVLGILENESKNLNKRFFTFHEKKRPYIILKWAQTLDGYIDTIRIKNTPLQPFWITNKTSRILVHRWRAEEDSIMVGTNTVTKDNPKLNIRDWNGYNPLRICLDRSLRIDKSLHLFDNSIPTIVFTEKQKENEHNLEFIQLKFNNQLIDNVLKVLWKRNVLSLIVEGGTQLFDSFFKQNLWDESRIFIGNKQFFDGVKAPIIRGILSQKLSFNNSELYIYRNA